MIFIRIINGQPVFENNESQSRFNRLRDSFNNSNKRLVLNIEEYSPLTTLDQHGLYKAIICEGSRISGMTYEEFEQELINSFAPFKYEKNLFGGVTKTRKSVEQMTNREFTYFVEQSRVFIAEFYGTNI